MSSGKQIRHSVFQKPQVTVKVELPTKSFLLSKLLLVRLLIKVKFTGNTQSFVCGHVQLTAVGKTDLLPREHQSQ